MTRVVIRFGIALGVLLILFVAMYWRYIPALLSQPQMFMEPTFDTEAPVIGPMSGSLKLLAFSKTNSYRHHEAIPAARRLLDETAAEQGWAVYHTENAAVFNPVQLESFDVLVLNNSTGTIYDEDQQQAFINFVESGGGVVAIHAAGDDSSSAWPWYVDELIRARFVGHPRQIQEATLRVDAPASPVVMHLGSTWVRSDEWYNFAESPRARVNVLMTIDESTYDPERQSRQDDHPMVWWHEIGRGRVLYSALGHVPETYTQPEYRRLLTEAVRWVSAEQRRLQIRELNTNNGEQDGR